VEENDEMIVESEKENELKNIASVLATLK